VSPRREDPPHQRARYWRLPRQRRLWVPILGWSLWGVVGLAVAILAGAYIYLDDTLQQAAPNTPEARAARAATRPALPGRPVNVLLIGADARPDEGDPGRSDSLILVRMDSKRDFISMLSFPRDLYVPIPGVGEGRINSAYFHGPAKTIETVRELTGEDVNYYFLIDFEGFEKLVDQVGGVYLDVDRRYFNDNTGPGAPYDMIDLQPGYQRLDGHDALDFVRYRHTDSDYARIARQQQFLSELKRQSTRLSNLTNITGYRDIFGENIQTDLTNPRRFLSLLELALTTEKDRIARVSIRGSGAMVNGASVEMASSQEVATKVAEWKDPEFEEDPAERARPIDPATVDVTVLNGSGRVLAAEDVAEALSEKGYRARVGGNADEFDHLSSEVHYAPGFREPAQKIEALLGPGASAAPLDAEDARGNEVVVIAGGDFTGELAPPPPPETRPPADTVDTTSLVDVMRRAQRAHGLRVMVPMKVARGSAVRILRPYRINTGSGNNGPPAVKIVFHYVGPDGANRYWGITMTSMRNPPILEGRTGVISSGGRDYFTYYDGRNLQRLAFQSGGVTYWISNTLANDLSAKTIEEIAKSMRPLNRAKLPKGRTDTPMEVELDGSTP
jgi:LCP family protein required for cell wall assembly